MMGYDEALEYCERKIPMRREFHTCGSCYWYTGSRCEVHGKTKPRRVCINYLDDSLHGNRVKEKILTDKQWVIDNWQLIDDFDRVIFKIVNNVEKKWVKK